jgi:hypothetical protein
MPYAPLSRRSPNEIPALDKKHVEAAERQLSEQQKVVNYDIRDWPVEVVIQKLQSGAFTIPDWQREFVWRGDPELQSRFIESVLLGIPIPPIFLAVSPESDETLEIIDGSQRIRTLEQFSMDRLALSGLSRVHHLDGFLFSHLSLAQRRRFLNRDLRTFILDHKTDATLRFELFDRINTGHVRAKAAEVRRGAFPGPFYDLVQEMARNSEFLQMAPLNERRTAAHLHDELVLRFFAYTDITQLALYDQYVTEFLNDYVKKMNEKCRDDPRILDKERRKFLAMVDGVRVLFGSFSKSANQTPTARFEAISVGVSLAIAERFKPKASMRHLIDDAQFQTVVSSDSANNRRQLFNRLTYLRDALLQRKHIPVIPYPEEP